MVWSLVRSGDDGFGAVRFIRGGGGGRYHATAVLGLRGGVGAALALPWAAGAQVASAAAGGRLRMYLEPVPLPGAGIVVASPTGPNEYTFTQRPIERQLHPQLPPTPLWAYDDGSGLEGQAGSFGMAVVAQSGTPVTSTSLLDGRPPSSVR